MRRGFTLLETLAAVVVLGWLAAAIVPLVVHLTRGDEHQTEHRALIALLQTSTPTAWPKAQREWEVADHPGYWWRAVALQATTRPPRTQLPNEAVMQYDWYQLAITQGRAAQAVVIADRVILVPRVNAFERAVRP